MPNPTVTTITTELLVEEVQPRHMRPGDVVLLSRTPFQVQAVSPMSSGKTHLIVRAPFTGDDVSFHPESIVPMRVLGRWAR